MILGICVLDSFLLPDELFANELRIFAICALFSNIECGKHFRLFLIIFIHNLKLLWFCSDFDFPSFELDSFVSTLFILTFE